MRWAANILLVFFGLIVIFFLINQDVDYEFIGMTVLDPAYGNDACGTTLYSALWPSVLNTNSNNNGVVPTYAANTVVGGGSQTTSGGKCTNFDLYNLTYDENGNITMYYVYLTHDGEEPRITAGMLFIEDSLGTFDPGSLSYRVTNLYGQLSDLSMYIRDQGRNFFWFSNPNSEAKQYLNFPQDTNPNDWVEPDYTFFNSTLSEDGDYNYSNTFYVDRGYPVTYAQYQQDRAPFLDKYSYTIPNFTLTEDIARSNAIDLNKLFDWEGAVDFSFNGPISGTVSFSVDINFNVTITPASNWNGVVVGVNVSAENTDVGDGVKLFSNNFNISVNSVNDAPVIYDDFGSTIEWHYNQNRTITLSDHFSDPDGDSLNYSASSMSHIDSYIDSDEITFVPDHNWQGSEHVVITANDSRLKTSSPNITLTVSDLINGNGGYHAPTFVSRNPSSLTYNMEDDESKVFSVVYTDADNDTLSYTWTVNSMAAQSVASSYTFVPESAGSFNIKVEVFDGYYTESVDWDVTVTAASSGSQNGGTGGGSEGPEVGTTIKQGGSTTKVIFLIIGIVVILIIIGIVLTILIKQSKKRIMPATVIQGNVGPRSTSPSQKKSYFENLTYDELTSVVSFIKKYRSRGVSSIEIKQVLLKKGWKPKQIDEAFKRADF
ncbi:MAG: Ig-like domain-containing protein [Candidatus Woesearchaeota archaeon]